MMSKVPVHNGDNGTGTESCAEALNPAQHNNDHESGSATTNTDDFQNLSADQRDQYVFELAHFTKREAELTARILHHKSLQEPDADNSDAGDRFIKYNESRLKAVRENMRIALHKLINDMENNQGRASDTNKLHAWKEQLLSVHARLEQQKPDTVNEEHEEAVAIPATRSNAPAKDNKNTSVRYKSVIEHHDHLIIPILNNSEAICDHSGNIIGSAGKILTGVMAANKTINAASTIVSNTNKIVLLAWSAVEWIGSVYAIIRAGVRKHRLWRKRRRGQKKLTEQETNLVNKGWFMPKLRQGGRWRRVAFFSVWTTALIGAFCVAGPISFLFFVGAYAVNGLMNAAHLGYEISKQKKMRARILGEISGLKIENESLETNAAIEEKYALLRAVDTKIKQTRREQFRTIMNAGLRILGSALAIIGLFFPPVLIAAAAVTVALTAYDLCNKSSKIKTAFRSFKSWARGIGQRRLEKATKTSTKNKKDQARITKKCTAAKKKCTAATKKAQAAVSEIKEGCKGVTVMVEMLGGCEGHFTTRNSPALVAKLKKFADKQLAGSLKMVLKQARKFQKQIAETLYLLGNAISEQEHISRLEDNKTQPQELMKEKARLMDWSLQITEMVRKINYTQNTSRKFQDAEDAVMLCKAHLNGNFSKMASGSIAPRDNHAVASTDVTENAILQQNELTHASYQHLDYGGGRCSDNETPTGVPQDTTSNDGDRHQRSISSNQPSRESSVSSYSTSSADTDNSDSEESTLSEEQLARRKPFTTNHDSKLSQLPGALLNTVNRPRSLAERFYSNISVRAG